MNQIEHIKDEETSPLVNTSSSPPKRGQVLKTSFFLLLYFAADMILPMYNKIVTSGLGSEKKFHYPVTITLVQVGLVALCLMFYCVLERLIKARGNKLVTPGINSNDAILMEHPGDEWIFSDLRSLLHKVLVLLPVSFLFAGTITLSNLGLDKVPVNVHVLLKTTSFIWVIIFSFFIKSEIPSFLQITFSLTVITGVVLLGVDVTKNDWDVTPTAIIINLASSFFSGAGSVLLRITCLKTDSTPGLRMSVIEITMVKMSLASIFILIPALVLDTFLKIQTNDTVWQALRDNWIMSLVVLAGALLTLTYQTSVVAVTANLRVISVGVLHQMITLPQIGLYTILIATHSLPESWGIKKTLSTSPLHISGSVLILVGVFLYACLRIFKTFHGPFKQKILNYVV
ncbi:GDP-fucose transporter [Acrasis kona]|uniref:GDP-fucose transporter n=1 Tax=Acrasis kona TaxID=1008807 RepID=A0AAW2ZR60_9EUKA